MYGIMLAGFLTFPASNASYFADFVRQITLVFIATLDYSLPFNRQQRYKVFWAGFYAHSARNAALRRNHGDTVAHA